MGTSTGRRRPIAAILLTLAGPSAVAVADTPTGIGAPGSHMVHAEVVRVSPRYGWREVSEPVRECVDVSAPYGSHPLPGYGHRRSARFRPYPGYDDHDRYTDRRPHHHGGGAAASLVGGLVGGLIGNQFGGGNGRKAFTVAGAMLGASVARDHAREARSHFSPRRGYATAAAPAVVRRCTDSYRTRRVRGPDGYDVSYRYQGRTFTKWTQQHPGETVPVRVAVEPLP